MWMSDNGDEVCYGSPPALNAILLLLSWAATGYTALSDVKPEFVDVTFWSFVNENHIAA